MTKLWTGHESVTDGQTEPITISPFFLRKGRGQWNFEVCTLNLQYAHQIWAKKSFIPKVTFKILINFVCVLCILFNYTLNLGLVFSEVPAVHLLSIYCIFPFQITKTITISTHSLPKGNMINPYYQHKME
jgi:hypothetical protein